MGSQPFRPWALELRCRESGPFPFPLRQGAARTAKPRHPNNDWVDNEQGLIVERTIALRPYPALKLFRDAMYASLKDKLPPDVWDYPTP